MLSRVTAKKVRMVSLRHIPVSFYIFIRHHGST